MAKKQTRRTISVSRKTYDRFKAHCAANDLVMAQIAEKLFGAYLDSAEAEDAAGLARVVGGARAIAGGL